jgi:cytochrome P450
VQSDTVQIEQIDLLDPAAYTKGQPWEWLRWLQENEPVSWHREKNGPGYWVVTKWADVKVVEGDWRLFSSQPTSTISDDRTLGDDDHRMLIFEDPPNHTTHRQFMGKELAPASVQQMRSHVELIANQIIDEVIEQGECDLVWDIAGKLASYVMADLLGMTRPDAVDLYAASEIVNSTDTYSEGEGLEAITRLGEYSHQAWVDRRATPRTDGITRLANGEVRGCPLDEMQFGLDLLHLITAAGDTTRNVVAGGMEALFQNPDQRKILFEGDHAVIASGVEEMLRWVSPITNQRRTVTADTEVGGKHIARGQKIVSFYGIANRDPVKFTDPWTFDVTRSPNPHLAFGFGTHFCVGSHLARLELNSMFRVLTQRIPDVEPAGPVQWNHPDAPVAPNVVGPKSMPVRFTPGAPSGL